MYRIVKSVVGFYRLDFVLLGKGSTLIPDKSFGSNLAKYIKGGNQHVIYATVPK